MNKTLSQALNVKIGMSSTFKNMTVFPLMGGSGIDTDYITLDEALAQKLAVITEVSEAGRIPELSFINCGGQKIFLLDGEELVGAKQNRILNLSIMVPAWKTMIVPVSCVEAGRWHHSSREFSSAPRAHHAEGRAKKMAHVSQSMKASGSRASNQGQVWEDIDMKLSRFKASSPTSAMSDIFEQQAVQLDDYLRSFTPAEDQVGAVFAIEGKVVGLELFDSPETLRKLYPKLLRSYGLDALDRALSKSAELKDHKIPTRAKAAAFIRKVTQTKGDEFSAVGEGRDLRLTGPKLTGAALAVDGRVVHLSAFASSQHKA
jgi:hypothetical protein